MFIYVCLVLGKKTHWKKPTGNKRTGKKRTGKNRTRNKAHAEKKTHYERSAVGKTQIQLLY